MLIHNLSLVGASASRGLRTLTVCLGGVVTADNDEILWAVVVLAREVRLEDSLGTVGVSLLGVEGGTGHVRNHGVSTTEWVGGVTEWVVLWSWLWEPDITTVTTEVTRLEGLSDILLDDDGTTGGVDEPRSWLHLGDELLVEETAGLLVKWAVDGDNITLGEHLLEVLNTTAADLLLDLWSKWLVVVVKELLAVEWLETTEDTLTDTADSDGTDNLTLKIELVLGGSSDVPVTSNDLLVGWDKVADEDEDGHDDVLSDGDDVGTGNLGNGDTAIGLVGSVKVDVVGSDTSGNGNLEVLGLGEALSGKVTWVEWSGDDDLSVYEVLVEGRVLTLLVGGSDELVSLLLEPLSDAKLVLGCTEELWDLSGVLTTIVKDEKNFHHDE